jgi:hypothetical protein
MRVCNNVISCTLRNIITPVVTKVTKTIRVYYSNDVIHFHTRFIQTPVSRIIIIVSATIKTEVLFIVRTAHKFIGWKRDCTVAWMDLYIDLQSRHSERDKKMTTQI